jgi:pimeloyl-ACP methyl ester carboxylesterase
VRSRVALVSGVVSLACGGLLAAPAGAAELVSIPSKGPGPAELDQVWVNKIGPDNAKRVLVLMPGTSAGAGNFSLVGRDIVKRVDDLAVWAIDRRSRPLEDTHVFEQLDAGDVTLQEAFDHYLGWLTNGGQPESHYEFLNADDHPYARDWGMKTALNDARAVIKEARGPKKKTKVWLGGHSLGASLTAAYAAWDFDGKPGFKDVEGIVLIDGGLLGSFDGFTLEEAQDAIEALETSNPFSDLLGIGIPESAGLFAEIGGSFARQDPTGSAAPLQDFLFLPDAFDPGFPVTNEALFGYAFDRDTSPESLSLLHANMGGVDPYVEGEISGWTDGGITPVGRMAKMFGDEPVNSVEWFFPKRLSIDTNGANEMEQNDVADFLGLRLEHTDDIDVPIYAFQTDLTNGGVLEGAQNLVDRAKTKEKDAKLVEGAPEQSHLDPLTAAPDQNKFLKTVVKFLGD